MAQRNPMNERYLGDGPGGQSRKSAANAKPASRAASSVHIKKKPQTAAEKRAARKVREKEDRLKMEEKARKAAEKAKAAEAAAAEEAGATGAGDGAGIGVDRKSLIGRSSKISKSASATTPVDSGNANAKDGTGKQAVQSANAPANKPKGFLSKLIEPNEMMPNSDEYRKWRRIYWTLILVGIVCIALAFIIQMNGSTSPTLFIIVLVVAYPAIIGALIVDFRKVKPLIKAHQQKFSGGNKSPKQLKHEQQAREEAAAIEAARKAAKAAKRAPKRKTETIVTGDAPDNSTLVPGEDSVALAPGQERSADS